MPRTFPCPISARARAVFRTLPLVFASLLGSTVLQAQPALEAAQYNTAGELQRPADLATWVHMGTTLGGDYGENAFDPAKPGVLGVVQMEPAAYRHFVENGEFADGSMFLLSFYASETKSEPQLQGFVQGALQAREIHVLDRSRFDEGHAFFMFPTEDTQSSAALPPGNECVVCHDAEGDYRSTFIQFYPTIRDLPRR